MKVRLSTDAALPGNLVIEAETPAEAVLLRIWGNEKRPLVMKNHGGNIEKNQISMLIGFREEKPSQVKEDKDIMPDSVDVKENEDSEKVHWLFLDLLAEMRKTKPNDRSEIDRAWAVAITETEKAFAYYYTWVLQATENE